MMYPSEINVLIACEESQVEMSAFRAAGFNAYSCDIQKPKRGANLAYQIQADVRPLLQGRTIFQTLDGHVRRVPEWDLIVAHPPCTYLCKVGSVWMYQDGKVNKERFQKMLEARDFFFECLNAKARYVAVENPIPMAKAGLPKPDAFVQPYWYGHPFSKKTLYWLRGLPPLMPDASNPDYKEFVRASRGKYRSRTFEGVAKAMVDQWGPIVLDGIEDDLRKMISL